MANERFVSTLSDDELNDFLKEIDCEEPQREFYQPEEHKLKPKPKIIYAGPVEKIVKPKYSVEEKASLMRSAKAQSIATKRQQAKEVKRKYVMSGNVHKLGEPVSKEVIKLIIAHMTEEYYVKANTTRDMLTKLIEKELRRFIPMTLKILYRTNKQAFAEYEGFEYETSPYYSSAKLLIKPDIPNTFSNPNEMQVLRAKCEHRLFTFDKLVERYYDLTKKRVQAETSLAIRLRKVRVLLDILDIGIFYYDAYMKVTNSEEIK
jgi:hypothetical protein